MHIDEKNRLAIPKIIHYCWFGGNPLPEDVQRYIATWRKLCPDYEIKEWNETNFDINCCDYVKEAYEAKKWAFITDYVRLKVLFDYGGIYMDTDVEVCKPLDDLLHYNAWSGFESETKIQTGTFASCRANEWIGYLLSYYENKHFVNKDGSYDTTTNVETITKMTKTKYDVRLNNTFQIFGDNYALFPFEYLCAKSLMDGRIYKSDKTYTIHHFSGSWLTPWERFRHRVKIDITLLFGEKFTQKLKILFK